MILDRDLIREVEGDAHDHKHNQEKNDPGPQRATFDRHLVREGITFLIGIMFIRITCVVVHPKL